jgi:hypothetical protein
VAGSSSISHLDLVYFCFQGKVAGTNTENWIFSPDLFSSTIIYPSMCYWYLLVCKERTSEYLFVDLIDLFLYLIIVRSF